MDRSSLAPALKRVATEFGPIFVFAAVYWVSNLMIATAVLMATTALITVVSMVRTGRMPIVPAVGTVILVVTGGLTLLLDQERFIKMRITLVNGLYGVTLLGSLLVGRPLLRAVMHGTLSLSDRGWRGLTWRASVFLIGLAVANEIVWRNFSTDTWVAFKLLGVIPLNIGFVASVLPYVRRHRCVERAG